MHWARELRSTYPDAIWKLVLLGTPTTTTACVREVDGVSIVYDTQDASTQLQSLAHKVGLWAQDLGILTAPTDSARTAERLVALVMLRAREGYKWTRDDFQDELLSQLVPVSTTLQGCSIGLPMSVCKTVVILGRGQQREYISYRIRNTSLKPFKVESMWTRYTDPGVCKVVSLWDGHPGVVHDWQQGYSGDKSIYEVGFRPRMKIAPGLDGRYGFVIERHGVGNVIGDAEVYSDPLLPTPETYDYTVRVVFPERVGRGMISCDGGKTTARTAWTNQLTRATQVDVSAMRLEGHVTSEQAVLGDQIANAFVDSAFAQTGSEVAPGRLTRVDELLRRLTSSIQPRPKAVGCNASLGSRHPA
jgi:hypothetical protein